MINLAYKLLFFLDRYHWWRSFKDFLTQLIYFRHNARVLADFEYRTGMITYLATNGTLSKPYYSIEALKPIIEDAFTQEYNQGYKDALTDRGLE